MHYKKPVLARNKKPGVTVLDPKRDNTGIEWQGYGDSSGGDIQSVPPTVANTPSFARALSRGIFEIVTEEEYQRAALAQDEEYQRVQEAKVAKQNELIDSESNREILEHKCVGPQDRGTEQCGISVIVEDIEETPPLCTKHSGLKKQYVKSEGWSSSGKKVVHWNRVVLGEREVGRPQ